MKTAFTFKRLLKCDSSITKKILLPFFALIFALTKSDAQYIDIVFVPNNTNATPGSNFQVIVRANFLSASPLDAIEPHFTFDVTKLQATAITNLSATTLPNIAIAPVYNNTTGTVDFAAGTTANYPTASFNLFSIDFTVLPAATPGISPLAFNTATTLASAPVGIDVLNSTINGTVTISSVGCTTPTGTIGLQAGPPTCDANPFNLILATASNGTGPFDVNITSPSGTATFNDIAVGGVITNFTPPTQPIFPATPTPSTFDDAPQNLTLGVRFQSSATGFVKGVRFFSPNDGPAVDGTFSGQLWTAGGVLLASGAFTGVVLDSWVEFEFTGEPILISAGTTYVASYHTNSTFYASTPGGLTAPQVNGSLTALANGGVYSYGAAVTFPGNATNNNYWADVIFASNTYSFALNSITDALGCFNNPGTPIHTLGPVTSVDCSTLPVSLINFSATPKDNAVLLRWSTASEFNNLGFEIQRSIDGNNGWSAIGFVNGAGNSNSLVNYSYVDENLTASRYYYRLKQIDIDQRFAYSPIVSAQLDGKQSYELQQNYPNPFRGETIIRFTLPRKTTINLSIFDMNGRLVKVLANGTKDSGTHAVSLNSGILSSGLYYYKLQAGDFSAVKKLTIR